MINYTNLIKPVPGNIVSGHFLRFLRYSPQFAGLSRFFEAVFAFFARNLVRHLKRCGFPHVEKRPPNGGRLRLSIKWQILRDGKVGQPLAAVPLYGCCIPLAGEGCARETQEGIHRRLRPNSGYCVSAVWEPSSKQARLIRHRRRFAYFPAPLKSLVFRTFIKF